MRYGDHITRHRGAIRFLLLALGIPQALIGLWALLAPSSFYDDFPAGTSGWVNPLGPFDEHLVTDVGALFVALGFLLAFAAVSLRRGTAIAAAVTWLLFAVPHFLWHVLNLEPYGTFDAVANTLTLVWTVIGGAFVLWLLRAPHPEEQLRGRERAQQREQGRRRRRGEGKAAGEGRGRGREDEAAGEGRMEGVRIEGVGDRRAGLIARSSFAYSRRSLGEVMEPTRVYAHHPTILAGYGAFELATEKADRVPAELKKLASTKAAALSGCEFCIDISSMLSGEAGITEAKLRALPEHATSAEFTEVERLVLDLVVGMTRTPVDVPEELFARLREHFDEAQLVELVHEIAIENYRARFNWAFGIGSQGFVGEGAYCVRPETVPT